MPVRATSPTRRRSPSPQGYDGSKTNHLPRPASPIQLVYSAPVTLRGAGGHPNDFVPDPHMNRSAGTSSDTQYAPRAGGPPVQTPFFRYAPQSRAPLEPTHKPTPAEQPFIHPSNTHTTTPRPWVNSDASMKRPRTTTAVHAEVINRNSRFRGYEGAVQVMRSIPVEHPHDVTPRAPPRTHEPPRPAQHNALHAPPPAAPTSVAAIKQEAVVDKTSSTSVCLDECAQILEEYSFLMSDSGISFTCDAEGKSVYDDDYGSRIENMFKRVLVELEVNTHEIVSLEKDEAELLESMSTMEKDFQAVNAYNHSMRKRLAEQAFSAEDGGGGRGGRGTSVS